MSHDAPIINDAYRNYVRILRQLHQLEVAEQAQSPAAAELEGQLEDAWEPLSADQRESAAGLGSDLNWIRRGLPPRGVPKEEVRSEDFQALGRDVSADLPNEVLHHLRHCAAAIPQAELAYLRGDAWAKLGEHETALLFFRHATRLEPTKGGLAYIALDALGKVDPRAALAQAREILSDPENHHAAEVVKAAEQRLWLARDFDDRRPLEVFSELVGALERVLERLQTSASETIEQSAFRIALDLISFCYEHLGQNDKALSYLNRAIAIQPEDPLLLVSRGMLLYGLNSEKAVQDFRAAIQGGADLVWPFLFLAHHRLLNAEFVECLNLCNSALRLQMPEHVRADIFEWTAICQAESDAYPVDAIRALFNEARKLAPENERIARNAEAFEAGIDHISLHPRSWEMPDESTVRVTARPDRPLRLAA